MTRTIAAVAALLTTTSGAALAGGLDRTGLPIAILFEEGNYAELGFARTVPNLSGNGTGQAVDPALNPFLTDTRYEGAGMAFTSVSAGVKFDITDQLSAALMFSQPFGAHVEYEGDPDSTELGGTRAFASSDMITALLRYEFDDNWSVHGGVRIDRAGGEIDLNGLAYGAPENPMFTPAQQGVNGYSVELERRTDVGWVAGVAYEIPDIALRVALTYNSAIVHDFDTKEELPQRPGVTLSGSTEVTLPRSVNLDFQTGIAEDTLLFGSFRWAEWSEFRIAPDNFAPGDLVELEDTRTWTVGVGRQFTDRFAARTSVTWEETDSNDLVSPLNPTNGLFAVGIAGAYDVTERVTVGAGVRYSWIGNARPETGTPDTARAEFRDNSAVSFGVNVGYRF